MRIVAPLAYSIRYIPRRNASEKTMSFVELTEWDIPEVSMADTVHGITARIPIIKMDRSVAWTTLKWRLLDGQLVREAGRRQGGFTDIQEKHLPRLVNGTIRSNFVFQFLSAMGLDNSTPHYNAAADLLSGRTTVEQMRRQLPAAQKIVSHDRQAALEFTQRILSRFVLIDGCLWKRTREPLLKLSIANLEMRSEIDFNERDEELLPDTRTEASWVRYLPFCEHSRIAEIEQGKHLPPSHHVAVDYISPDAPVTRDGNLWHASRAASYLLAATAAELGDEDRQTMASWMDLRDVANGEETTTDDLLKAIDDLRASLSKRHRTADATVDELLTLVNRHSVPTVTHVGQSLDP